MSEPSRTDSGRRPRTQAEAGEYDRLIAALNEVDARAAERDRAYSMALSVGWTPSAHADLDMLAEHQPLLQPLFDTREELRRLREDAIALGARIEDLEGRAEDFERDYATESYVDETVDARVDTGLESIPGEEDVRRIAVEEIDEAKGEYEGLCQVRDDWQGLVDEVEELKDGLRDARAALMRAGLAECPLCKAAAGKGCVESCPNPGERPQRPSSLAFFAYQSQDPGESTVPPRWRVLPRWLRYRAMHLVGRG